MTARAAVAAGALVVAAVLVAVLLLGGGAPYAVTLQTTNASQLVKGNVVTVSGKTVGKVTDIKLAPNGLAEIKITISDDYAPLREGTRAVIRQASLSGVANRYVDIQQGPMDGTIIHDGDKLPTTTTEAAVDLDQLFNAFDTKTRQATRTDIKGLADLTQDNNEAANEALRYFNPLLSTSQRLFGELGRNDDLLKRFIVMNARLVTDAASKEKNLAGLVDHFGTVSTALASQDTALTQAINRLPTFLRSSNTTFVNLRQTLDDLDPLVAASEPVVRDLGPLLADLRPFAADARPTFRDLAATIQRPGAGNDLVELLQAQAPLSRATTQKVRANGKLRPSAFKSITDQFNDGAPELAFFRPYAPDLTGWFDDFSTSGVYDANGAFSRAGLTVSAFTVSPLLGLVPVPPELRDDLLTAGASTGRNNRCPGSTERGAIFKPSADFNCDDSMVPLGP
ncbi:MAG: phospholipid/cholesterol/gamma-HCH transport system substrate-binding protein [Solirubrobacteraceae bacterium]|nr:phospholipid/cholesterol/gamma-HCH transport system substrate-binding protein [Solirubrobacteraceae bacterium]